MWNIFLQALLHLAVITIVAIIFHFMYFLTIPSDMKLLKHVSDWALSKHVLVCILYIFQRSSFSILCFCFIKVGLAYFTLVYDWVKAAVMFGVINTVSRLDHLDPPRPPKCITMLYVFSET